MPPDSLRCMSIGRDQISWKCKLWEDGSKLRFEETVDSVQINHPAATRLENNGNIELLGDEIECEVHQGHVRHGANKSMTCDVKT